MLLTHDVLLACLDCDQLLLQRCQGSASILLAFLQCCETLGDVFPSRVLLAPGAQRLEHYETSSHGKQKRFADEIGSRVDCFALAERSDPWLWRRFGLLR